MTIDTSYNLKYLQKPLDISANSGGNSVSSGLYCIDSCTNFSPQDGKNPFAMPVLDNNYDSFNYSPCLGMDMSLGYGNPYFSMPMDIGADYNSINKMYNDCMQNLLNSFSLNFKMPDFKTPSLSLTKGAYTPSIRVQFKTNNDDYIKELQPAMQQKVRMLEAYAKSQGIPFKICSGYRTRDEQIGLQKKYAGQKGRVASADGSPHRKGLAIDIATNGLLTEAQCTKLGNYAKSIGMRWGGEFKTCRERWHFDLPA